MHTLQLSDGDPGNVLLYHKTEKHSNANLLFGIQLGQQLKIGQVRQRKGAINWQSTIQMELMDSSDWC